MDTKWKSTIWKQFGAAIDMLEDAIVACPQELWEARLMSDLSERPDLSQFWYVAYHALFWLDLYLTDSIENFSPPAPFTLVELDPAGLLPERVYSKTELQNYAHHGRRKCNSMIYGIDDEMVPQRTRPDWFGKPGRDDITFAESLLYNLRHVQEHASQLNLFLGQRTGSAPDWVVRAEGPIEEE